MLPNFIELSAKDVAGRVAEKEADEKNRPFVNHMWAPLTASVAMPLDTILINPPITDYFDYD